MNIPHKTLTLFALLCGPAVTAGEHSVHPMPGMGDFTSPAAALASPLVLDGDTVNVAPGTYVGMFDVVKAVLLVSDGGPGVTTLDGDGLGPVVHIAAGATVEGFTITGGSGPADIVGGVLITSLETATLRGNVIAENHPKGITSIPIGGVGIDVGASARLIGNDIHSNTSTSTGGLFANAFSSVEIVGNRIRGNGGGTTITGGALIGGTGRMVNNLITGNLGTGIGGLYIAGGLGMSPAGSTLDVINCTIYGNVGSSPIGSVGGVLLDDGGDVTIVNSIVLANMGSVDMNLFITPDFSMPPALGTLDLSYSHFGSVAPGVIMGPGMLPFGLDPFLAAPAAATPFFPVPAGDFALTIPSPGVDAGIKAAFPADLPDKDALGTPRFTGASIDLGAIERPWLPSTLPPMTLAPPPTSGPTPTNGNRVDGVTTDAARRR